ncbi:VSP [Hexamita inflata]|uniref:VSP n=1 Tax=Hexamita inflata TaxID=28002 RepID=A0AA86TGY1_9EUKA|nr:VSP [Hexamita inflata]
MFALLISQISASTSGPLCGLWFDVVNGNCSCSLRLSSDKTRCAPTCAELGEIDLDGTCVPQIVRKNTDSDGCKTGSVADGNCACDTENGFAGPGLGQPCENCWKLSGDYKDMKVVSSDGQQCVTCSTKYGQSLAFNKYAPYKCAADLSKGPKAVNIDDKGSVTVTDCAEAVTQDGSTCATCADRYSSQLVVYNSTLLKCSGDLTKGIAVDINLATDEYIYPITKCWDQQQIVTKNGKSCETCSTRFKDTNGLLVFNSSTNKCSGNLLKGVAVEFSSTYDIKYPITKCWETPSGAQVVSHDGFSCQSCDEKYETTDQLVFNQNAPFHCTGDLEKGIALKLDAQGQKLNIDACWAKDPKLVVSTTYDECISCNDKYQSNGLVVNTDNSPYYCSGDPLQGVAVQFDKNGVVPQSLLFCWQQSPKFVVSSNGQTCESCDTRFGGNNQLVFNNDAPLKCSGDLSKGYAVIISESGMNTLSFQRCWDKQKVVSANFKTCETCNQRYTTDTVTYSILVFNNDADFKCSGDLTDGYAVNINKDGVVADSLVRCWDNDKQKVVSANFKTCETCNQRYTTDTVTYSKLVFNNDADFKCSGDLTDGYAVNINKDGVVADSLVRCWDNDKQKVVSANFKTCETCNQRYTTDTVTYSKLVFNNDADFKCSGDLTDGYAVNINKDGVVADSLVRCWDNNKQKVVSANFKTCETCNQRYTTDTVTYSILVFNNDADFKCSGDLTDGYAVNINKDGVVADSLVRCWDNDKQKVVSANFKTCQTCNQKYPNDNNNLDFNIDAPFKCAGAKQGYAVDVNANGVDVSTLTDCWGQSPQKVVSVNYKTCQTCDTRYNTGVTDGLAFDSTTANQYHCVVNVNQGYAGQIQDYESFDQNYPLINCWKRSKLVSSTEVDCDLCSSFYQGEKVGYERLIFAGQGTCQCDPSLGYAQNSGTDTGASNTCDKNCFDIGKIVSSDGQQCIPCSINSVFKNNKCVCNSGFAGHDCSLKCWQNSQIVSQDGMSCESCHTVFGDGSIYNTDGNCKCNNLKGFAGKANDVCVDCWRNGFKVDSQDATKCSAACDTGYVRSLDELSCVTCAAKFGPGSIVANQLEGTCKCNQTEGFAGAIDSVCSDCWRNGFKVASATACSTTCDTGFVRSQDELSCVTCAAKFGAGSIVANQLEGTCKCNQTEGFAGAINEVCSDCWKVGKMVDTAVTPHVCKACNDNKVLQDEGDSRTCKNCPTGFVFSADHLSCITCVTKFGPGSKYKGVNVCECDETKGFAGTDDSTCSNCWSMGLQSGSGTCAACTGKKVLQNGVCAICDDELVHSADNLKCITCAAKFGDGSIHGTNGDCKCNNLKGFAGKANDVCVDCWRNGFKVDSQDATKCLENCEAGFVRSLDDLSCVTCVTKFGPGSKYKGVNVCECDETKGFAGTDDSTCSNCWSMGLQSGSGTCAACTGKKVLQNGVCAICDDELVHSADNLKCITCAAKFGDGSIHGTNGDCKCNNLKGFAGKANDVCVDCWRNGFKIDSQDATKCLENCEAGFVRSLDDLSCVTCVTKFGPGSKYKGVNVCECDETKGFAGTDDSTCSNCWSMGLQSGSGTCAACTGKKVLQNGVCAICDDELVHSADNLKCITCAAKFGDGSIHGTNGDCKCNNLKGFAGKANDVCVDCWRNGFKIDSQDATKCLENCEAGFVRSLDDLSCVTCVTKFGPGSKYKGATSANATKQRFRWNRRFYLLKLLEYGIIIWQRNTACTGKKVLQNGVCANAMMNQFTADNLKCITCAAVGDGSIHGTNGDCKTTQKDLLVKPTTFALTAGETDSRLIARMQRNAQKTARPDSSVALTTQAVLPASPSSGQEASTKVSTSANATKPKVSLEPTILLAQTAGVWDYNLAAEHAPLARARKFSKTAFVQYAMMNQFTALIT